MFGFKKYATGPMQCVDIRTGNVMWSHEGYGPGNVILAGDQIIGLSDAGYLTIVEAKTGGYKEVARAQVLNGKCWSSPILADGHIYVRSTKEGACFDVR